MMKKFLSFGKGKIAILLAVVILITVGSCLLNVSAAERVVIENDKDPSLEFVGIHGYTSQAVNWEPVGSFKEPSAGKYEMKTNSYCQWWEADSLHFAYKQYNFNYSGSPMLTATTKLDYFNGRHSSASAGLMIRGSIDPSAPTVFLHCRTDRIMVVYRPGEKQDTLKAKEITAVIDYPVSMKIEYANNKVVCYYKQNSGKTWVKFATVPFINLNPTVCVGLSAHSTEQDFQATAKWTSFETTIDADEGYTSQDPSQGGGNQGGTEKPEEEQIKLPEDLPVADNVLLMETFTDGSLVNRPESKTNWTWDYYTLDEPGIVVNEDHTNRYLYDWNADGKYYYVGDQHWTDYEASVDLTFTSEYSEDSANMFCFFVRHTDITQYGYFDYSVYFTNNKKTGQSINLGARSYHNNPTGNPTNLVSVPFKYLPAVGEADVEISLRVVAFDNKIKVYINDETEPIIDAFAHDNRMTSKVRGVEGETVTAVGEEDIICTEGNVGFMVKNAAVKIDNVKVTKLEDYLGGDYDNRIGGNWETSIETEDHYLSEWKEYGWAY
ncbi:MAG: hypothetical protein IJP22_02820 [Clostridia bacterium]|nr:hypothetical protein [Clostridia bacterium]